jgi:hypothetical protein
MPGQGDLLLLLALQLLAAAWQQGLCQQRRLLPPLLLLLLLPKAARCHPVLSGCCQKIIHRWGCQTRARQLSMWQQELLLLLLLLLLLVAQRRLWVVPVLLPLQEVWLEG